MTNKQLDLLILGICMSQYDNIDLALKKLAEIKMATK